MSSCDFIFYSFHTPDEYYSEKARCLKERLSALNFPYRIDTFEIPEGFTWPDICRKKVGMIYDFYLENPGKKIFWIDVDCYIDSLPAIVKDFSADIVGFQRGFSTPKKIGYQHKTRFWEPCFWGINASEGGLRFIEDAYIYENNFSGVATDDFFFEESWRLNCQDLSFQIIPSTMAGLEHRSKTGKEFFFFGSSGNVSEFKGKVEQHTKNTSTTPQATASRLKFFLKLISRLKHMAIKTIPHKYIRFIKNLFSGDDGSTSLENAVKSLKQIPLKKFQNWILQAGINGDLDKIEKIVASSGADSMDASRKDFVSQAKALATYMQKDETEKPELPLMWWINPAPGNFGDWLSPYLFKKISHRPIKYVSPNSLAAKGKNYFGIGSIGKFATEDSIVLGSGVSSSTTDMNTDAKYLSVRGPLTRDLIVNAGGICPEVYGDPAILLPKVFSPRPVNKNGRVALIRHFKHAEIPLLLPDNMDEISIFAAAPEEIENFISRLHEYDYVISSAMHGYIVCQAYKIPVALVTFMGLENAVHGDGTKYRDYFMGVGLEPKLPHIISRNLRRVDFNEIIDNDEINPSIIENLYQIFLAEFGSSTTATTNIE